PVRRRLGDLRRRRSGSGVPGDRRGGRRRLTDVAASIARRLRWQAGVCAMLDSPLYELLLERAADDVVAGGPVATVLEGRQLDPPGSMLGLRLMAAVHRLVLDGSAPAL